MNTPVIVDDIRPLIALLVPWVGMVGIIWAGEKRPNLRELFTFIAASVQAAVVLSLVPVILGGAIIEFHIWQIFSYVPMLLRVDGPGLLLPAWPLFFGLPQPYIPLGICVGCTSTPRRGSIPSLPSHCPPPWGWRSRPIY